MDEPLSLKSVSPPPPPSPCEFAFLDAKQQYLEYQDLNKHGSEMLSSVLGQEGKYDEDEDPCSAKQEARKPESGESLWGQWGGGAVAVGWLQ
jgi:hypothetical protein